MRYDEEIIFRRIKRTVKRTKRRVSASSSRILVENADLSGWNMDHVDFSLSTFRNVCFNGASLKGSTIENSLFDQCTFRKTCFQNANMKGAALRYDDLTGADIRGANLFSAVLEFADLTDIISDEDTKFFRLYCPEKGAFLGYKKCFNNRLVQLLIPADAKRTSATLNSCRCSKAKVLTIKSFDYSEEYDEAWSLVDENFVYRRGQWVEVKDFNEDRGRILPPESISGSPARKPKLIDASTLYFPLNTGNILYSP